MSDQRRYLLAYGALHTAGIETLIVRLANHLARDGGDVAVCFSGGALASALGGCVVQLDYSGPTDAVRRSRDWLSTGHKAPAVLISFDPISAALGLAIETGVPVVLRKREPLAFLHLEHGNVVTGISCHDEIIEPVMIDIPHLDQGWRQPEGDVLRRQESAIATPQVNAEARAGTVRRHEIKHAV